MKRKPALLPVVEPVEGEFGVYWVQSRSRPSMRHRVDMTWYGGNGKCGCEDFGIRFAGLLERGAKPDRRLACWHVRTVREYSALEWWTRYVELQRKERANNVAKRTETESHLDESVSRSTRTGTTGPRSRVFSPDPPIQTPISNVQTMPKESDSRRSPYARPSGKPAAGLEVLDRGVRRMPRLDWRKPGKIAP